MNFTERCLVSLELEERPQGVTSLLPRIESFRKNGTSHFKFIFPILKEKNGALSIEKAEGKPRIDNWEPELMLARIR